MAITTEIDTALIGVFVSAATAGAALLIDFFKSRSPILEFDHAANQFDNSCKFLGSWVATYQLVTALEPGRGRDLAIKYAETVLTHAQESMDRMEVEKAATQSTPVRLFRLLNFLRIGIPRNGLTWIPQLLYYASIGIGFRVAWTEGTIFNWASSICVLLAILFWACCFAIEHGTGHRRNMQNDSRAIAGES